MGIHTKDESTPPAREADRERERGEARLAALSAESLSEGARVHETPASTRERERESARREILAAARTRKAPPVAPGAPGGPAEVADDGAQDDVERGIISDVCGLEDARSLRRVISSAKTRIKELGLQNVVEAKPHGSGILQLEYREARANEKRRGPYWTYNWVADGRRRTLYIGKTDEPEAVLERKLAERNRREAGPT